MLVKTHGLEILKKNLFFSARLLFCQQTCDVTGGKHIATPLCVALCVASVSLAVVGPGEAAVCC